MKHPLTRFAFLLALTGFLNQRAAAQIITFNVDFESPTYTPGYVGAGNYVGQDNWTGFGYRYITNSIAHSGSQSLASMNPGFANRAFETPPPNIMNIGKGADWYMEAWVYVLPGPAGDAATFEPGSALGGAFFISVYGDGTIYFNSGVDYAYRSAGANVLNQWLRLRITHPANDLNLEMSVFGNGINETFSGYYATPWNPSMISVGGSTAYWDDIRAVSDGLPAVPEPSSIALAGLAAAGLAWRRRQG